MSGSEAEPGGRPSGLGNRLLRGKLSRKSSKIQCCNRFSFGS